MDGTQVKVSADSKVLPDAELKVSSVSDEVKNKADQAVKNKLDPEAEILEIMDIKAIDKTTNEEKQQMCIRDSRTAVCLMCSCPSLKRKPALP